MLKHAEIDLVFQTLGDPTRRALVEQLSLGPAVSVSELAAPLPMSLPAVHQHLKVLEHSGLVRSEKVGRVRTCRLGPDEARHRPGLDRRPPGDVGTPPGSPGHLSRSSSIANARPTNPEKEQL